MSDYQHLPRGDQLADQLAGPDLERVPLTDEERADLATAMCEAWS